jgi:hypothetical protein
LKTSLASNPLPPGPAGRIFQNDPTGKELLSNGIGPQEIPLPSSFRPLRNEPLDHLPLLLQAHTRWIGLQHAKDTVKLVKSSLKELPISYAKRSGVDRTVGLPNEIEDSSKRFGNIEIVR